MVRAKHVLTILLLLFCTVILSSCGDPQKKITVYGDFQDSYTTDCFDVDCDWEAVNPLLVADRLEKYGLYPDDVFSFSETEESINAICINSRLSQELNDDVKSVGITYGALECNSVQSIQGVGERYFQEPMIEIYLYNPEVDKCDIEPDYIRGYRAVYSLDGELTLEEGQWFLDTNKDEFCKKYFELMLKAIGKDK